MLGIVEVRGCACWWWLIFELVLAIPAKAPAKTCWGCSPYPSVTFAHDCKGGTFVRVRGEQLENGTSEANGKSKVQIAFCDFSLCPSLASSVNNQVASFRQQNRCIMHVALGFRGRLWRREGALEG